MRFSKVLIFVLIFAVAFAGGLYVRHTHEKFLATANRVLFSIKALAQIEAQTADVQKNKSEADSKTQTLLFVGDIMLSRGVDLYVHKFGNGDFRYPFLNIADTLRAADFTFGNLEGPISSRGANQGSIYSFRADPKAVEGLKDAGFDAMSVANNHIFDYGRDALEDTITLLSANRIVPIGAGMNYAEANDPKIFALGSLRLAVFGFTNLMPRSLEATASHSGLSQFESELIKQRIGESKKENDIVIVSMHWGEEYQTYANTVQKQLAHEFINAGADLVIGHHPHVVEEVATYEVGEPRPGDTGREHTRTGYIAYSLGNFVFDQGFSDETREGLMLKVEVSNKKITNVEKVPIRMNATFQPEVVQ